MLRKPEVGNMCFGCGTENPIGLKLEFHWEGNLMVGQFTPQPVHQGFPGMVHGGIIAALLDEVMAAILFQQEIPVVTAEMTVRYMHKVPVGDKIRLYSRLVNNVRRLHEVVGWLENEDDLVLAKANAKMLAIKQIP